jgi:hypothetical protein
MKKINGINESIGVDLDGTLAEYNGFKGLNIIGKPVKKMKDFVLDLIDSGEEVKIFTARAHDPKGIPPIKKWLKDNGFPDLEITNVKDPAMKRIYDDRAVQVLANTGILLGDPDKILESYLRKLSIS